ncbi:MAG: hypothetical protein R3B49_01265 [Phycisphaerales bacterium]
MNDQAPPTPPPHRDDDLARLYLAGRDVPCPKCKYNRRDGDRARCPECGHALTLAPGTTTTYAAARTAARWLFICMIVFGALGGTYVGFAVLQMVGYGLNVPTLVIVVVLAAGFLVPLGMGIGGLRALIRPLRQGNATPAHIKRLRTAGIIFLVSMLAVAGAPFLVALLYY